MKYLKRTAYIFGAMLFSALTLLAQSPVARANSYFGGNGRITFYSPVTLDSTAQEVYTANADGTDLQRVTSNQLPDANPQWNPDADQIAFDSRIDSTNKHDIYTQAMNADGTPTGDAATAVSGADTTENEWDPSWSPDGGSIAFHRRSTVGGSGPNHIFTIDSTGGTAAALTGGGAGDTDFRDTEPTWSKDGTYLTFTRTNLQGTLTDCSDEDTTADDKPTAIAVVPAGGTEADVVIVDGEGWNECLASPQWSPSDNRIVYTDKTTASAEEINTVDLGDSFENLSSPSPSALTSGATIPWAPTFSPDGKIIAASGNAGIAYYNSTTGALLTTVTIADDSGQAFTASNGIHEVDWARAAAPDNSVHDCTIYVNETCNNGDFDPEIPDVCSTGTLSEITTDAKNGTPGYSGGNFTYKPDKNYVGTDKYVYTYYDSNMNAITCTVNITVLPKAPATGEAPANSKGLMIGSITAAGALSVAYAKKKRLFRR